MPTSQPIIQRELDSLCRYWGLETLDVRELPQKALLPGKPVKGEEAVVRLGAYDALEGHVEVFHSTDPRDVLGNANWARGWRSCLTHSERGASTRRGPRKYEQSEEEQRRDAESVSRWATMTPGVSLLYVCICDSKPKKQGVVTRRPFEGRLWLFELECGARVWDALYGNPGLCFDFKNWLGEEGLTRYGLLSSEHASRTLAHNSLRERTVRGNGPLTPALERKRAVWPGWTARRVGTVGTGARFWTPTRTELLFGTG